MTYYSKTFLLIAVMFLCSVVGFAQNQVVTPQSSPTVETDKQRKEREKREAKQRKEDEKRQKTEAKAEKKRKEQEFKAHLATPAIITVSVSPETLGQVLTAQLTSNGFTFSHYEQPQQVFGAATPYKAVYTTPTSGNEVLAAKIALGALLGPSVGETYVYMAFELGSVNGVTTMRGYMGYIGATTAGQRYYETTYTPRHRPILDQVLEQVRQAAERQKS